MSAAPSRRRFAWSQGILPFLQLAAVSGAIFAGLWWVDYGATSPIAVWTAPEAASTLTSVAEVTVGVLGIAITVVAIIVELAANRYTPRISELFVRDPVNTPKPQNPTGIRKRLIINKMGSKSSKAS